MGLPTDLEVWLLLGYVVVLWLGAWLLEVVAKVHFHRAQRYADAGFEYDAELDHYECPQGERLTLHTFDDRNKLAIYRAPAAPLQRVRAEGLLHPARRRAARLPVARGIPRDRRRAGSTSGYRS